MVDLPELDIRLGAERLGRLDPASYDEEQKAAAAAVIASPRGQLRGPFIPMIRSPELMDRTQRLGEFLRYRCSVPERLREWAIIVTARIWDQPFEWHVHAPLALAAGVSRGALVALKAGEEPVAAAEDERAVYAFVSALHRQHFVSDAAYDALLALWGERGVVDLVGICGYYAMLAMMLNTACAPVPGEFFAIPD